MTFLELLRTSPFEALIFLFSLVVAITVHEFAHAWSADKLGDDTPRLMGRVTLNPLSHLDPIGSLAFILVGFGWGRPVLYNPLRLLRRSDELLIALAGPASNLLLAILFNILIYVQTHYGVHIFSTEILQAASYINVLLAAFNMLPIPPLDGSAIVAYFWPEYRSMMGGQVGLIVLLVIIFSGVLGLVISPVIQVFSQLTHLFGILL
ncbi:MAG TPA: site-2 protease family protein [Verrucomicrobiae bacterium]|nr:site-2 protease family protein [Verrucomicrobiae bacterium]